VLELDNCNECKDGILTIQLADGSLDVEPCPCVVLTSWYELHAINTEEE